MTADAVPGEFDWVVMLHVLEHVFEPVEFLQRLHSKLTRGGRLVIEVPDHRSWPFDLVIADHASHFSAATLRALLVRAGYSLEKLVDDWVPRELTALAVDRMEGPEGTTDSSVPAARRAARASLDWLKAVTDQARSFASGTASIAIFGSSIGATWLAAQLEGRVACFVDEDPSRDGRSHMGIPIVGPDRAPVDVPLYLALPPSQAEDVNRRLGARRGKLRLILPPIHAS
jgi:hypothetical protein